MRNSCSGQRWRPRQTGQPNGTNDPKAPGGAPFSRLVELRQHTVSGELRIRDAGIVPGIADPAPFAQTWALAASNTSHEIEAVPGGRSSALGTLNWMKFSLTLWLPEHLRVPFELHSLRAACPNKARIVKADRPRGKRGVLLSAKRPFVSVSMLIKVNLVDAGPAELLLVHG
jgi:hypothetical protein